MKNIILIASALFLFSTACVDKKSEDSKNKNLELNKAVEKVDKEVESLEKESKEIEESLSELDNL